MGCVIEGFGSGFDVLGWGGVLGLESCLETKTDKDHLTTTVKLPLPSTFTQGIKDPRP